MLNNTKANNITMNVQQDEKTNHNNESLIIQKWKPQQ